MNLSWARLHSSLAFRLVALFTTGSALIMLGVGYILYHALAMQVEARDLAEIHGKTEVVQHILGGIRAPAELVDKVPKFREIGVGHPHLSIGLQSGGVWLLRPDSGIANAIPDAAMLTPGKRHVVQTAEQYWWVQRVRQQWRNPPVSMDVLVAIDVSDTHRLLREHRSVAILAGVLGTLMSGVLAFIVARRSVAPLSRLASQAEQLTAARLGAPLDLQGAPSEVRGLVESLNGMLSRLNDSFRSLEDFSADLAHELRTPLNNLMLQTQVTLSRPRDVDSYIETLHSNLEELERLQRMVTDMLFLARADRGLLKISADSIDLRQEVDSVVDYFDIAASEHAQAISVIGQLQVMGDRLMLRRVLNNLISNAVRYAPNGARITILLGAGAQGRGLEVRNPVSQVIPDDLPQLFERFKRGKEASRRDTDGVGLGLAIAHSIVRLHQGQITGRLAAGEIVMEITFADLTER